MTRSPIANPFAPGPSPITSPATSKPGMNGSGGLPLVLPPGDQAVGEVDPTGVHPQQQLLRAGARRWQVFQPQPFGAGEFVADDGPHGGRMAASSPWGEAGRGEGVG
jgi:ribosomal protein L2